MPKNPHEGRKTDLLAKEDLNAIFFRGLALESDFGCGICCRLNFMHAKQLWLNLFEIVDDVMYLHDEQGIIIRDLPVSVVSSGRKRWRQSIISLSTGEVDVISQGKFDK